LTVSNAFPAQDFIWTRDKTAVNSRHTFIWNFVKKVTNTNQNILYLNFPCTVIVSLQRWIKLRHDSDEKYNWIIIESGITVTNLNWSGYFKTVIHKNESPLCYLFEPVWNTFQKKKTNHCIFTSNTINTFLINWQWIDYF
jgi:hypothetical protein